MVALSESQQNFMDRKIFASLSITSPNTSLPLVTTVWAHFEDGKFYIISNKATAKWRYLKSGQTAIGINICDPKGWPYISVNGHAKVIHEDDRSDFWELIERIIRKYNTGQAIDTWLHKMHSAPVEARRFLLELDPENLYTSI